MKKKIAETADEISIHAAQEGCDSNYNQVCIDVALFQSTQPKRAATFNQYSVDAVTAISIHAAQEGCDSSSAHGLCHPKAISIHAAQEGCDRSFAVQGRKAV